MKEVKRPVVSVVVPVYNTEPFLAECLHSLEKQTLTDIEIILVNDGSTDNSGRMLVSFMWNRRIKGSLLHEIPEWNMLPGIIWHFWTVMTGWQRMLCRCYVLLQRRPVLILFRETHWRCMPMDRCKVGKEGAESCLRQAP